VVRAGMKLDKSSKKYRNLMKFRERKQNKARLHGNWKKKITGNLALAFCLDFVYSRACAWLPKQAYP
jgi:hypothetical protein